MRMIMQMDKVRHTIQQGRSEMLVQRKYSHGAGWNFLSLQPNCPDGETADAQDLKSWAPEGACGFESRSGHYCCSNKRGSLYPVLAHTMS